MIHHTHIASWIATLATTQLCLSAGNKSLHSLIKLLSYLYIFPKASHYTTSCHILVIENDLLCNINQIVSQLRFWWTVITSTMYLLHVAPLLSGIHHSVTIKFHPKSKRHKINHLYSNDSLSFVLHVSTLIILCVCKLVQFGCTIMFKSVGGLRCCSMLEYMICAC